MSGGLNPSRGHGGALTRGPQNTTVFAVQSGSAKTMKVGFRKVRRVRQLRPPAVFQPIEHQQRAVILSRENRDV